MNRWTLYQLTDNFRCGNAICYAANRLMSHQPGRLPKETISAIGQPDEVVIKPDGFDIDDAEAHAVANDIEQSVLKRHGPAYNECAVLVRTNALADFFKGVLKAHGLPVREPVRTDLPADWARARSSLALLANPDNDRVAFQALLHSAGREKAEEVRQRALAEYKTINDLALHIHHPHPMLATDALGEVARMNVSRESVDAISRFLVVLPPEATVFDLILAIGRETVQQAESDGVAVLTGHAAKGREFRAVWCPAWNQEIIPGARKDVDVAEERRLAFVMLTRAADRVWVSWAKRRASQWGGPKTCTASQFIHEIQA